MDNEKYFEQDEYFKNEFNTFVENGQNKIQYVRNFNLEPINFHALSIEQVIYRSIEEFEYDNPSLKKIRSDAKLFLMINYVIMVYRPLFETGHYNEFELKKLISLEVRKILEEAKKASLEITAHQILKAGNKIWGSLKTLGNESW